MSPPNPRVLQSLSTDYFNESLTFGAFELLSVSLLKSNATLYQLSVLHLNVPQGYQSSEKGFVDSLNKLKGQVDLLRKGEFANEAALSQFTSHSFVVRSTRLRPTVAIQKGVVVVSLNWDQFPGVSTFASKDTYNLTRVYAQLDDALNANLNKTLIQVVGLLRELPGETMSALQDVCSTVQREFITFGFQRVAAPTGSQTTVQGTASTGSQTAVQGTASTGSETPVQGPARLLQSVDLSWDLNFTTYQRVVCPAVGTRNSTLVTRVINAYLTSGVFTDSFNQLLGIRTNGTGVITKVNGQNAIFKVNGFEQPLPSYSPTKVVLNLTTLSSNQRYITQSQVISKGNAVIFEVPSFVAQVSMAEDDNCLFPLLMAGYDLIPTISVPTQDKSLLILKASQLGFASAYFPDNQPVSFPVTAATAFDPPELRVKLFNQTVAFGSSVAGARLVCLAACLYFKNQSVPTATVSLQFLNPQVKKPRVIPKTEEIQNFRISPNDYELAWFNKSSTERVIYWNTTQAADLTLIFDYASVIFSKHPNETHTRLLQAVEPDLVRQVFTADNGVTSFDLPPEKEGRMRIINNSNQASLQVSIIILPASPPTKAYVYITVGVVLGVVLLLLVAAAVVLLAKRYRELERTKRMFPIMTNDIMKNSNSDYKQLSEFVNQNNRNSYKGTDFSSEKNSRTPELINTDTTPDAFFQVTFNDVVFRNQSVALNQASVSEKPHFNNKQ